ncbi:MAG: hypothetical protein KIH62_005265, partial [Candidatus Kerfeldbacteria bacterium]|nr:hypothetical protein [Candidatus Kerfeldbacteria bacterium]
MKKYILFTFVLVAFLPHLSFAAERISASAISNATLEDGTTATFTIQLDEPIICVDMEATCEVTIPLSVSDDTEGSLDVSEITFDYTEWFTTQT